MSLTAYPTLLAKLRKKEYRDAFRSSSVRYRIALQTRALRKAIFGSQKKLGEAVGKPANVISRLENPSYGKATIQTLLELAAAFDIGLIIKFARFEEVIKHSEDLDDIALLEPSFEAELAEDMNLQMLDAFALPPQIAGRVDKMEVRNAEFYVNGNAMDDLELGSFYKPSKPDLTELRA